MRFGDGDDLQIYHDSSNSYITDSGSGNLLIGSDNDLWITNAAGTENKARFTTNGGVNLYHDNSKKFETTTSGVSITGSTTATGIVSATSYHSPLEMDLVTQGQTRVAITSTGTSIFKSGLAEKYNNVATNAGTASTQSINSGNVIKFTGNETGNNISLDITDVHGDISSGESVSVTVIITPNNIGNFNAIQIDGQTPAGGLKWLNGNAPVASASGEDIYTFSILKTGSSATDYVVYGAKTNYA